MNRLLFFASNAPNAHKASLIAPFFRAQRPANRAPIRASQELRCAFFRASNAPHRLRCFVTIRPHHHTLLSGSASPPKTFICRAPRRLSRHHRCLPDAREHHLARRGIRARNKAALVIAARARAQVFTRVRGGCNARAKLQCVDSSREKFFRLFVQAQIFSRACSHKHIEMREHAPSHGPHLRARQPCFASPYALDGAADVVLTMQCGHDPLRASVPFWGRPINTLRTFSRLELARLAGPRTTDLGSDSAL